MKAARQLCVVTLAVALGGGCAHSPGPTAGTPGQPASIPPQAHGPLPVVDVVDGDTLTVARDGAAVTVRLLGVDAPEIARPGWPVQGFGPEAAARATELLDGQQVWLETDPSQETVDGYGRELAYLWLPGGRLVNLQLIAEGYAREYTHHRRYRYQDTFRAAQAEAENAGRGLWSPAACPGG